ncbi:M56 family metallopeptidase [Paenibacillus methanolicus]|uniref:BlaR1 peptidase M56 n=1 Tax=Paenibacillus methanolicus TaxID=582686 RepID=A0A5S5BTU7_9BACL|nr:M56 family metallopeptidase [Paenibacillus methanolicus]TYP70601.1 BlaR1 peptidase M56 [Paenibacillus methanolicus]
MRSETKLRGIYGLMILFVTAIVAQMGFFLAHQFRHGAVHGVQFHYVLIDLVIAYTIGRIIWRFVRQWHLSRKWLARFGAMKHDKHTKRLRYKYRVWGTELIVVQSEAFVALTIGLLRPRIVVSTAVLGMFDDKEIQAILLHERHHCRNRDNMKLFVSTLLMDGFRYLPIVKPILTYYKTWQELFADRAVIRGMGTTLHLGQVLIKLAKHGRTMHVEPAVHFEASAMHYRMLQVLEPDRPVKVPIALLRPLLASCSIVMLLMLGGDS